MNKPKLTGKLWTSIILFSLFGQIAWVVENMYFNVFIFQEFQATSEHIALMVSLSAIAATVTTLFMGALSDKIGKRKLFIVAGYILWGLSIISFALLKKDILAQLFPYTNSILLGISLVITFDCIMTFFGSTANDAALNAWVTDLTHEGNRGRVEGFLASLPLIAVLVVFGGFMGLTAAKAWDTIFIIIGSLVLVVGFLGIFLIQEVPLVRTSDTYFKNILYGFRPSVLKKHHKLYYLFLCYAIFGIAVQVFMPYLIIYYQYRLELDNYVMIFAPAILLASVITVLYGRFLDKVGFRKAIIPAIILFMVGLLLLGVVSNTILVFIATLFMLGGNLSVAACFGAAIRDHTPTDKVGLFQGLRMFSYVLLPMLIGPWIGSLVIQTTESILGDDGVLVKVPTSTIFIASLCVCFILVGLVIGFIFIIRQKPQTLLTKEGENLDTSTPLKEYPRPQLVRDSYFCLHGWWDYHRQGKVEEKGKILVPYPIGATLSGVITPLQPSEIFTYKRTFSLPHDFIKDSVLLHLDGVDQFGEVIINGQSVGHTTNAYIPAVFDITSYLEETNTIEIVVKDPLDKHYPYGKQSLNPGGIWYTQTSGLWKSVWIESVPSTYLKNVTITPLFDTRQIIVSFDTNAQDITINLPTLNKTLHTNEKVIILDVPKAIPWTPENPNLYPIEFVCGQDITQSYFAMRKVNVVMKNGLPVIALNDKALFLSGLLDQGYYSDGLLTPATYNSYIEDIKCAKEMGFNILRKHIKVEPLRFYYECDRLGVLVWQDMVNNGSYQLLKDTIRPMLGLHQYNDRVEETTQPYLDAFASSMKQTISLLYNSPSIILWTIYNEGWGQIEADKMYALARELDKTRLIDATSGWFHEKDSDVDSLHIYFKKIEIKSASKPIVLSEFGGYSLRIPEHSTHRNTFGYRIKKTPEELEFDIEKLYVSEIIPAIKKGLAAAIYTQLSDVEEEVNGLVTFDRKLVKVSIKKMREIHQKIRQTFEE